MVRKLNWGPIKEQDTTPMGKAAAAAMLRDALGDLFETADGMDESDPNRERILHAMNDTQEAFNTLIEDGTDGHQITKHVDAAMAKLQLLTELFGTDANLSMCNEGLQYIVDGMAHDLGSIYEIIDGDPRDETAEEA